MTPARQLPLPGSPEARDQGCTCPQRADSPEARRQGEIRIDNDCPVHGLEATARDRAAEAGHIDTEGDIVDTATEPQLRRS